MQLELSGDIVERQDLLNGTQIVTLEGASDDGEWSVSALLSWNIGLDEVAGEGDITVAHADGREAFGSVTRCDPAPVDASDDAEERLAVEYEIDGGSGALEGAAGSARADLILSDVTFRMRLTLSLGPA